MARCSACAARARRSSAAAGGGGWISRKGDIHYRFVIDVPDELTEEQSAAVQALADASNGNDPRARLFEQVSQ